jgi:hypothetical protein
MNKSFNIPALCAPSLRHSKPNQNSARLRLKHFALGQTKIMFRKIPIDPPTRRPFLLTFR